MSDIQNIVRDRIAANYMGKLKDEDDVIPKKAAPKKPVVMFLDEFTAPTGAIMYSQVPEFEGAEEYLKSNNLPDIDITPLMRKDGEWDEGYDFMIPKFDQHYKWQHKVLYPTLQALLGSLTVLTVGPTGSGKTTFWENLSAVFKQPFYRLGGRGDMESDTILGRADMQDGSMNFLLGEFTKAYSDGCLCLLDEIWKLPPNINMAFQRVLERKGILQIDDMPGDLAAKQFKPHEATHLVMADNVVGTGDGMDKYAATQVQDGSTINRVDMILHIGYLEQQDEINMLQSRFEFLPEHVALKAVQIANLVRSGFESGQVSATMSPRNLIAWMELAGKIRDYNEAFKWTMLERYADESEKAAVRGFWQVAFGRDL